MRAAICAVGRARWAAAATLVVALVVAGCGGSGPSQPGAAAIVGGADISVNQVQDQLYMVLRKEGDQVRAQLVAGRQLDDLSRQIVTLQIRHELIEIAAKRAGLSVNSQQVSKLLYDLGGLDVASKGTIWDAEGFREHARDQLLMTQLGRKTLRTAVTFDYTSATTRQAAFERADQLAKAGSRQARELIKADADASRQAAVNQRVVAGDDPIFAASPAFGVDPGTAVAFQLSDTEPWLIAVIRNRTEGARPSAQAPDPDEIDPGLLEAIGLRQLAQLSKEVGIRLSPRYGVWDPVNLKAVADENEV
ncbi:MAG: SurA N-terminal domain-containing protein, partial [Actinobacteria bacterium]|nr:SurA N-terminal domain-containing protein [Actinomycetota bacterium]